MNVDFSCPVSILVIFLEKVRKYFTLKYPNDTDKTIQIHDSLSWADSNLY
jgi:hypothetical protein